MFRFFVCFYPFIVRCCGLRAASGGFDYHDIQLHTNYNTLFVFLVSTRRLGQNIHLLVLAGEKEQHRTERKYKFEVDDNNKVLNFPYWVRYYSSIIGIRNVLVCPRGRRPITSVIVWIKKVSLGVRFCLFLCLRSVFAYNVDRTDRRLCWCVCDCVSLYVSWGPFKSYTLMTKNLIPILAELNILCDHPHNGDHGEPAIIDFFILIIDPPFIGIIDPIRGA